MSEKRFGSNRYEEDSSSGQLKFLIKTVNERYNRLPLYIRERAEVEAMYFGWRHNIKGLRSPKAAYHGLPIEQEKIDRLARDAEQLLKEIESLVPKNQSASINKLNGKPN